MRSRLEWPEQAQPGKEHSDGGEWIEGVSVGVGRPVRSHCSPTQLEEDGVTVEMKEMERSEWIQEISRK